MEDSQRTLVVLLSMHRCGSSLATNMFHRMGMSLGPFELMDAAPSNPHGHFEAIPFYNLNRQVQELAFGFPDDLPDSRDVFARFWETKGEWPPAIRVPDRLLDEGRSLIRALVDSGEISGFKDPRTVLTWPFWERVLRGFPGLRVVPVSLLRSPHEIAMSLVTRRHGWCGYWTALDAVAVHLRRQKAILETCVNSPRGLCFGSPSFLQTLIEVIPQCGLHWNAEKAHGVFDQTGVHHVAAVIEHEAQALFESLCPEPAPWPEPARNRAQLINDARFLESLQSRQWQSIRDQSAEEQEQTRRAQARADELGHQLREAEARLLETRLQLLANQQALIESQRNRTETQESLIRAQAEAIQAWHDKEAWRGRVDRIEAHPLLGPVLRARRGMRKMVHSIAASSTHVPSGRGGQ